mgnify:FL=1
MLDIRDRDYFIRDMQGENVITQVIISRIDSIESIVLAVPIYKQFKIIGVLRAVYQLNEFTELLEIKNVDKTEISLIIQEDGTSVSRPDILGEESNFLNHAKGNQATLIHEEIGINDWYIVSIIAEQSDEILFEYDILKDSMSFSRK